MLRVTNQTMMMAAERSLGAGQARLAAAQERASSGSRIARPSDDPLGTADALRVHGEIAAAAQYKRNIDNGTAWLTTLDSALGGATALLRRARDLAVQGGNGALNQDGKNALADQVDAVRKDLLAAANTQYLGRNVFAGTPDAPAAFTDGAPPVFNGAPGGSVQRRLGPDRSVRVDADGAAVFGTGAASVFSVLDGIAADLRGGGDPTSRLQALDGGFRAVVSGRADVGTRLAQLERAGSDLMTQQTALEAQRSGIEDVDLGKAALDLQLQQTAYQAALAVTARTLPPSLMDFLK
ncbi:flagellar hook-associated protein FlgL [Sinomonas sp. ASV322]|uniref:flagellar hook-associated protein FlgL n=1 Tax=Sinomonas sp. ASV322 TaxID=3041920 RepID=UPI0027DE8677|nr:flagellar hook-associated protein FlgL [Sinomonas sp. ASV322]MDQ4504516.1 flagellar hook-associated protein FlgL [Sinomonas sp. ASV322]